MGIIVQKFGGTSVADIDKIKNVAQKAIAEREAGNDVVVVVSAMGDTTDRLIEMANQITDTPAPREYDMLVSTGEQVTISLLALAIQAAGGRAISKTGQQVGIVTDQIHSKAKIVHIDDERLRMRLEQGNIVIVAGFQGTTHDGAITTLGRGGSDTTAVALAGVLEADRCDIYTDVDGVYTADPRVVKNARKLDRISYDEMLELATLGARVLHNRSVELAKRHNVPLQVRSTFNGGPGTIVTKETKEMEDILVSGVAYNRSEAKITILGVPDRPGVAAEVFEELEKKHIVVDMIIQNVAHDGTNDIAFTVNRTDLREALECAEAAIKNFGSGTIESDDTVAKVSAVGVGMQSHSGIASRMFRALAEAGVNIQSISTSEIKISCLISQDDVDRAVQAIHDGLELQ